MKNLEPNAIAYSIIIYQMSEKYGFEGEAAINMAAKICENDESKNPDHELGKALIFNLLRTLPSDIESICSTFELKDSGFLVERTVNNHKLKLKLKACKNEK